MIKTLRITGFLAVIIAVGFFVFSVFFGLRPDDQIEAFLLSDTVLDEFKQNRTKRSRGANQSSPLVEQARIYAEYLNPTPKPPPKRNRDVTKVVDDGPVVPPPPPPPTSVTFEVFGVSYYPSRPEESLAWIVSKNKQKRWARQGEEISHWTISKITEDRVTVTSGKRSAELEVKRPAVKSLLLKDNAVSDTGIKVISTGSSVSQGPVSVKGGGEVRPPMPPQIDPEQSAASMQALFEALAGGGKSSKSGGKEGSGFDPGLMEALRESMKQMNARPPVPGGKIESKSQGVSSPGEVGIDRLDAQESKKIKAMGKELKKEATDPRARRRGPGNKYNERRRRLSREAIERARRKGQERKEQEP